MKRVVAQCNLCGNTLTPEEIEIGMSLVCPRCEPTPRTKRTGGKRKITSRRTKG